MLDRLKNLFYILFIFFSCQKISEIHDRSSYRALNWNDLEWTVLLESKIESSKIIHCFRSNKDLLFN